jgi:type I restriction enzyme S subunit
MGEAAIVPEAETVCLGQRTMLLRFFPSLVNNRFILYSIQSPSFQQRLVRAAVGMTVKHLRVGDVGDLPIPLPPKLEQDRLVALIEGLLRLCDQLSVQLGSKRSVATRLSTMSAAAISGVTPELNKDVPMKTPKVELISQVRLGKAPESSLEAPLAAIIARHAGEMAADDLWQRFGSDIDVFYAQLKLEVAHGWLAEPAIGEMREASIRQETVSDAT